MVVEACDCVALAKRYQTPLFVVDRRRLEANYRQFETSFRQFYPRVEVGYSYKTNPLPGVLSVLHGLGASAEVVSPNELKLALELGVPAEKIIYNGPGKTMAGLELAVANRIRMINIDGFEEIDRIADLAARYGHQQAVGVRVVTDVGWVKKFGFSIKLGSAFKAFERIKNHRRLDPCGIHFHLSTGVGNVKTYLTAVKAALRFADQLHQALGISINVFDFGGGFDPLASVHTYSEADNRLVAFGFPVEKPHLREVTALETYGREIGTLMRQHFSGDEGNLPTVMYEPGRAITGNTQFLLLQVLDVKPTPEGVADVILDGGRNVASPTVWEHHQLFNASRIDAREAAYYTFYGPLCTPYDPIYQVKRFAHVERGDILALMDAGAYFVSMLSNFCSFPKPAAVMVVDGHHELIRQRESFWDLYGRDIGLPSGPA